MSSPAGRIRPSREEFHQAAQRGNLIPVYRELVADGDTPVTAFAKLGRRPYSFLLESVVGGETWAAYSFIGVAPRAVLRVRSGRAEVTRFDVEGGRPPRVEETAVADPAVALGQLVGAYRAVVPPGLPRFFGGAVGYLGYDVVRAWERLETPRPADTGSGAGSGAGSGKVAGARDDLGLPEAQFIITDTLVIFDNLRQTVKLVASAEVEAGGDVDAAYDAAVARIDDLERRLGTPVRLRRLEIHGAGPGASSEGTEPKVQASMTRDEFLGAVRRAKDHILAGDAFQIVLSQRFGADRRGADPFDVYRALRVINPSPYMYHLELPGAVITGASPETLVRLEGQRVVVRPIAGTRRRGADPEEDARLERELLADEKERAEHVMLIDLGRNDVGRVARPGTVRVEETMAVERYSHVMHLVSLVSGELAPDQGPLEVLRAGFPAGTLSGAPKIRAMQIIDQLEPVRRGLYGGAVGYVSFPVAFPVASPVAGPGASRVGDGTVGGGGATLRGCNLDLAIAIRTLLTLGERVYVQAGAGIVYDSVPEHEFDETVSKAKAVLRAVAVAQRAAQEG
jgi:anthranilate synthase component 1